ncbi:MAG: CAP domain-containing protein, partial [Burkholderiaceae bacterium]
GLERFNANRQLMGLAPVSRSAKIDNAAQGHSKYQARNDTITHDQISSKPDFTGVYLLDRLTQANYKFEPNESYAYGEVISKTDHTDGAAAAEALITAIYHRFVIFEPMFKEAGAGATSTTNGKAYFTTDFAASNGFGSGLVSGNRVAVYPYDTQQQVPTSFDHSSETPDAFPKEQFPQFFKVLVGYPISIHTNITECITTSEFTVRSHSDGTLLPTRLLTYDADIRPVNDPDPHPTPLSAAAIVPLSALTRNTQYDVSFTGSISAAKNPNDPSQGCVGNGTSFTHAWSFTTQ